MYEPDNEHRWSLLILLICLTSLVGLACADNGAADLAAGTSTGGRPTTAELPTSGTSGDDLTPTSTAPSTSTSTSTGSTGEDPDSSGSDSTDAPPVCGDGSLDPGEECDDSLAGNDNSRYCTADCTLNVCGDGKLFVGWELCDQGVANSNDYGSLCSVLCVPGERCGDHKLQPEFETCDLGPNNGGSEGDDQGIRCDAACNALRLRGFVTSDSFSSTGDLDGLFGADLKCRSAAEAAGLTEPHRFHALLSTSTVDANTRFAAVDSDLPYVFVTGTKFADNFHALLVAGPVGEGFVITETGAAIYQRRVLTNTAPGGGRYSPVQHCQDWTSADPAYVARIGYNAVPLDAAEYSDWQTKQGWIGATAYNCKQNDFHLYCLEI